MVLKYSMLGHQLVYVVVIPIFQAEVDVTSPHSPFTVADSPLSKGSNTAHIAMQFVGVVIVHVLNDVACSYHTVSYGLMAADLGPGLVVLNPVDYVLDHKAYSLWSVP